MILIIYLSFFFMMIFFFFFFLSKMSMMKLSMKLIFFYSTSVNFNISINFLLNTFLFFMTVFIIGLLVSFYIYYYMNQESNFFFFIFLMISFLVSMFMLIFSSNWLVMFIGWDGLGISSYFLVINYQNQKSFNSGSITILTNRFGDILFMMMMIFFFFNYLNFNYLNFNYFFFFLLIILYSTKSAQFPFSSWLPAAMAAPTPISALVHSSTLVTAGIFILYQLWPLWNNNFFLFFLQLTSLMTLIYSGLMVLMEQDLKKIIALSTLNQLSLILLVFSTKMILVGYFHLITHAFFKSSLFLTMGILIHQSFSLQDGRFLILFKKMNYFFYISLFFSSLNLMGLVFSSGFFSKDMVLENNYFSNNFFSFSLFFFSLFFTFIYNFRLMKMMKNNMNVKIMSFSFMEFSFLLPIMVLNMMGMLMGSFLYWNFFSFNYLFIFNHNMKLMILLLMMMILFLKNKEWLVSMKNIFLKLITMSLLNKMINKMNYIIIFFLGTKMKYEQSFIYFFFQKYMINKIYNLLSFLSFFFKGYFYMDLVILLFLMIIMFMV